MSQTGPEIQCLNLLLARVYWKSIVLERVNVIKAINERRDRKTGWDRKNRKRNSERKSRGKHTKINRDGNKAG